MTREETIEIAHDVFDALANRFPKIADSLIYREFTERETAAMMGWNVRSLRKVLSDYRSVLRRAKIATIAEWQQLLKEI